MTKPPRTTNQPPATNHQPPFARAVTITTPNKHFTGRVDGIEFAQGTAIIPANHDRIPALIRYGFTVTDDPKSSN